MLQPDGPVIHRLAWQTRNIQGECINHGGSAKFISRVNYLGAGIMIIGVHWKRPGRCTTSNYIFSIGIADSVKFYGSVKVCSCKAQTVLGRHGQAKKPAHGLGAQDGGQVEMIERACRNMEWIAGTTVPQTIDCHDGYCVTNRVNRNVADPLPLGKSAGNTGQYINRAANSIRAQICRAGVTADGIAMHVQGCDRYVKRYACLTIADCHNFENEESFHTSRWYIHR